MNVTIGAIETERIVAALADVAQQVGDLGLGGAMYVAEVGTMFRGVVPGDTMVNVQRGDSDVLFHGEVVLTLEMSVLEPFFEAVSDLLEPEYSSYPVCMHKLLLEMSERS